jgi:hypothetical protein
MHKEVIYKTYKIMLTFEYFKGHKDFMYILNNCFIWSCLIIDINTLSLSHTDLDISLQRITVNTDKTKHRNY